MENFTTLHPTAAFTFVNDEPCVLFIFQSCSTGLFHVIKDEPGPDTEYFLLSDEEIKQKFNIDINLIRADYIG